MSNDLGFLLKSSAAELQDILVKFQGVMISCSGHLDSTALFHVLSSLSKQKKKFLLGVIHFNYGLRGADSDEDQAFVRELAKSAELPFYARRVGTDFPEFAPGKSIQEWARDARRQCYSELAGDRVAVALGHHQHDVAETVLMRLARGSGPGQLSGIKSISGNIWRPMLAVSRRQIENWAVKYAWRHRTDHSNDRLEYSRNVIRHQVLTQLEELYPGASERIAACAEDMAEVSDAYLQYAPIVQGANGLELATDWIRSQSDGAALGAISRLVQKSVKERPQLYRRELLKFVRAAKGSSDRRFLEFPVGRHGWLVAQDGMIRWRGQPGC